MTPTDELRKLLDERGVEYTDRESFGKHVFHWGEPVVNGAMFTDGGEWTELVVENATPQQAIDATLGRGECHNVSKPSYTCSECGWTTMMLKPRFCPGCGRKVVDR